MGELLFVGLGLWDARDITLKGLEAARSADEVYMDAYTSLMGGLRIEELEDLIGKKVLPLSRKDVEEEARKLVLRAKKRRIAFLVPGDPMVATTHIALRLEAEKNGVKTRVIHGVSIYSAAPSICGLESYKFGRSVTIPFPEGNYFPETPYLVIKENFERGLHTLIFLDIKKEKKRFMTINEGLKVLAKLEAKISPSEPILERILMVGMARVGSEDPAVKAGYFQHLLSYDFGPPPHILIATGKLHFKEAKALYHLANAPRSVLSI